MFGFDPQEIVIIGVILLIIGLVSTVRRKGNIHIPGPTLVLREFKISKSPAFDHDEIITIVGRSGGIFSWLFTLIGLEAEYFLKVTGYEIKIEKVSLFGQQHVVVPLSNISSAHCGYIKPISYLIVGSLSVLTGIAGWISADEFVIFFTGLVVSIVFFVAYWLLKKIEIKIHTRGGH